MTEAWPSSALPYYPLSQSYGIDFGDRRQRTQFEQGESRHRSIVRSAKTGIRIGWAFTPAAYEKFRAFYAWTISDGADEFTMPVWTGTAYETCTVRFVKGQLKVSRAGGEWMVGARLETNELPVMSSGALDVIIGAASGFPAWPSSFPQFVQNGLQPEFQDRGVIRSDFDLGEIQQRRIFHAAPVLYRQEFILTGAQFNTFRAWRKYRINSGEGSFTVPIFQDAAYVDLTGRMTAGTIAADIDGAEWRVRMEIELPDLPRADASVLA